MPVLLERGDIRINGKEYRIEVSSFRHKDVVDFSPRASVPGGSIIHNELMLYQNQLQERWDHGFGFPWFSDAAGYMKTVGDIDTRHGVVIRMTKGTSSDTNNNEAYGYIAWNGALWKWGVGGLRKYASSSWSDIGSFGTVNWVLPTKDYLFVCPDGARIRKVDTSDTVTDAGLDANSTDYKWLIIHNGYIYAGKDGTSYVHYDSELDLSQLHGDSSDTARITVGGGGYATVGAIVYSSNLYIARTDGLWQLGEDLIARRALDFSGEIDSANFQSMAVHNGYLVFPIRDSLVQWNGVRTNDITPQRLNDEFPYITYGNFDNFVVRGQYLYMTAQTVNDTSVSCDLLCYDGVGWHKLKTLSTGTDVVSAMGWDSENNYIWYHVNATADVTYFFPLQDRSDFPYANFDTSGTHEIHFSRYNMGFNRVKKSMPSVLVEASGLTTARYLTVYYKMDFDTTWTEWGTVDQDGTTELTGPGSARTREYNFIRFKVAFVTNLAGRTPVLEKFTVKFLMRPDVLYGYSFQIPLADNVMYGTFEDKRTAYDILFDLEEARDSKAPIEFVDIWGRTHYGYITSMDGRAIESNVVSGERPVIESVLNINFIEVSHAEKS